MGDILSLNLFAKAKLLFMYWWCFFVRLSVSLSVCHGRHFVLMTTNATRTHAHKHKSFIVTEGLLNHVPFGLTNAPATYQRSMHKCIGGPIIFRSSFEEHLERLNRVWIHGGMMFLGPDDNMKTNLLLRLSTCGVDRCQEIPIFCIIFMLVKNLTFV